MHVYNSVWVYRYTHTHTHTHTHTQTYRLRKWDIKRITSRPAWPLQLLSSQKKDTRALIRALWPAWPAPLWGATLMAVRWVSWSICWRDGKRSWMVHTLWKEAELEKQQGWGAGNYELLAQSPWWCVHPSCCQGPCPVRGPTSVGAYADIYGLCCHLRPSGCQWSGLLPETMLMFCGRVDAEGIGGRQTGLLPLEWTRPMLPPGAMSGSLVLSQLGYVLMSQAHVTTKGHVDVLVWTIPEAMLMSQHCAEQAPPLIHHHTLESWHCLLPGQHQRAGSGSGKLAPPLTGYNAWKSWPIPCLPRGGSSTPPSA
jgi:hypothetical protein